MNPKRLFLTLVIAVLATSQMAVAKAQSELPIRYSNAGWAAIARNGQATSAARQDETPHAFERADAAAIEPQEVDPKKRIVGSWIISVSPDNSPAFESLQTYNDDGTMNETSSLLPQLNVSPARGMWDGKKSDYNVTFEMFAFAPTGEVAGRLRVRAKVQVNANDTLDGDGVLDFIQPDGTVIPNIGITPFVGTRLKVLPRN